MNKTGTELEEGIDTLTPEADCLGARVSWRIPVPRVHEHCLLAALAELRAACARTQRQLVLAQDRQQFEQEHLRPAYDRVGRELAWMLQGWGVKLVLPEFSTTQQTATDIRALLEQMARNFNPECPLLQAARTSCIFWVLRHIGLELLPHAWTDDSFDWFGRLGPQSYPCSREFAPGIWELATEREQGDLVIVKELAQLRADDGVIVSDPAWATLALRKQFQESFWGQLPALPLAAWASAHGWPDGLWDRIEKAGLGCGPWIVEERQILEGELDDDGFDPFGDD